MQNDLWKIVSVYEFWSWSCLGTWTLHAKEGQNIQLHFQDFALEMAYDVLEIRDGVTPYSELLGDFAYIYKCFIYWGMHL